MQVNVVCGASLVPKHLLVFLRHPGGRQRQHAGIGSKEEVNGILIDQKGGDAPRKFGFALVVVVDNGHRPTHILPVNY